MINFRKRKCDYSYDEKNKKPRLIDAFSSAINDCNHISMSITGKSNSGKTQRLKKILESDYFKYTFSSDNIIYLNDSLDTTIPDNFPDIEHVKASSFTKDEIGYSLMNILKDTNKSCNKLIIFDDMTHIFPSGTKTTILAEALKKMANGGRHSKLHYIFIAQKYTSIPVYLRVNLHHCILFKPNTKIECTAMLRDNEEPETNMLKTIITSLKEYECCFINKESHIQRRYLWNESSFEKV